MPMAEDNKALQGFSCHGATKSWVLSPEKTCYLDVMKHQKFQKNQNRLNHVYLFHKCILIINALHVLQINVLLDIDRYF